MSSDRRPSVVTGAAGFIGARTAVRLAESGQLVVGLDLPGRDSTPLREARIPLHEADISDPGALGSALAGLQPGLVVHCAAFMGGASDPATYQRVNVEGTRHVAAWAAAAGAARLIYISSVTVYGLPAAEGVDEESPQKSVGMPYADSKIEAERVLREFAGRGLAITILRPGDVYGPRSHEWVTKLVEAMRAGRLPLIGGGRGRVNLTYVDNLVDAIEAAAATPAASGRDYIITDGSPVTWGSYLTALAAAAGCRPPRLSVPSSVAWGLAVALEGAGRLTGRRPPLSRLGMRLLTSRTGYDISRARRELGWEPRVGFEEGMRRVAGWIEGDPPAARA